MNIGERVHNIIDDRDMKQTTLAKRLGIPLSTLNGYMTGRNQFPSDVIQSIAKELETTADYLLELTDDPTPTMALTQVEQRLILAWRTLSKEQRELIAQNIRFMQEQNQR